MDGYQNNQPPYGQPYMYQQPAPQKQGGGLATASMICGLIGAITTLFCCCCGQWYITLILGALGVIFGIVAKAKKCPKSGSSTAGIILGAVALLAVAVCIVIVLTGGSIFYPIYESAGIDPEELQRLIYSGASYEEIMDWVNQQIENNLESTLDAVRPSSGIIGSLFAK